MNKGLDRLAQQAPLQQQGFTLIELMVTLTVMAIVMTVLLKSVAGQQDHLRYSQTVERLDKIKNAIIEVSSVNGSPTIGGFVADMGRLPANLHELLEKDYCPSDIIGMTPGANPVTCAVGEPAVTPKSWQSQTICQDSTILDNASTPPVTSCPNNAYVQATLSGGWKGPYLHTTTPPSHVDTQGGSDALTDGWGNEGYNPPRGYNSTQLNPDPRHNYGWYYSTTYTDSSGNSQPGVIIYSYGDGCYLDSTLCKGTMYNVNMMDFSYPIPQAPSPSIPAFMYSGGKAVVPDPNLSESPPLPPLPIINTNQWQTVIGDSKIGSTFIAGTGVNVTLIPSLATSNPLCLNLYFIKDGKPTVASSDRYRIGYGSYGAISVASGSLPQTYTFAFPPNSANPSDPVSIPAGNAAFGIHDGGCIAVENGGTVNVTGVSPSTYGSTGKTYPTENRQPVAVKILPGQTPSFVW